MFNSLLSFTLCHIHGLQVNIRLQLKVSYLLCAINFSVSIVFLEIPQMWRLMALEKTGTAKSWRATWNKGELARAQLMQFFGAT
jgi:hypothetical protein